MPNHIPCPPKHAWNTHKTAIKDLYLSQNMTLKEAMKIMSARGFRASEQQYETKLNEWGFSKYRKRGGENVNDQGSTSSHSFRAGRVAQIPQAPVVILDTDANPGTQPSWHEGLCATSPTPLDVSLPRNYGSNMSSQSGNFNDSLSADLSADLSTDLNADFSADWDFNPDLNDPINMYYSSGIIEPLNFGVPMGRGGPAASRMARTATTTRLRQPIHQAAQSGYLDMVKLLLEDNPMCASFPGADGATALWVASQQGHLEVVKFLLAHDVDINSPVKESQRTPIHQAAQEGHTEVVKLLLDYHAMADEIDNNNTTPLWSAAQQGHHEIVQILINAKANIERASTNGSRVPIHQAAQNGHLEVVRMLLDAGARADPDKGGWDDETPSPLWLAAQQGHFEIAKLLLDKDSDVGFVIHPSMRCPLHQAAQEGHINIVRLLLENKADVNAREQDGWPPLMIASQKDHIEIVELLLRHNADVNAEEKDGATALWIASQQGHTRVIKRLLDHQAKSHPTRSSLRKPIHQAAQNGHLEAVKLLLGQDPEDAHVEDKANCTPLLLASQGETPAHLNVARYFIDKGAKSLVL